MKKSSAVILSIIALLIIAGAAVGAISAWRSGWLQRTIVREVGNRIAGRGSDVNLLQEALGFNGPRTYLLLFLNNTELRPGGGFIGSYGVVRLEKGVPSILKVEGTEIIDHSVPKEFLPVPPRPLADYLLVQRWYFRDSNWSPDFASSAVKSMELYRAERGLAADELDGVIGITPTLISELLKITGPIKVGDLLLDNQNFTEKVQYETEYGYLDKGVERRERKSILGDLAGVLLSKIKVDIFLHWSRYYDLAERMLREKQALAYFTDNQLQGAARNLGVSGEISHVGGDYLLWVDANLGALKTDAAMRRELFYSIAPTTATASPYLARVKMKYIHTGKFDWRTTRYRTYARLYAPLGSVLVSSTGAMKEDRSREAGAVDHGVENGRQWFGAFISIEPGKTGELSFRYYLSPAVAEQIRAGSYSLLAQKELGLLGGKLTLGLNFGKELRVASAQPGEESRYYGDSRYDLQTDLQTDRWFEIKLK